MKTIRTLLLFGFILLGLIISNAQNGYSLVFNANTEEFKLYKNKSGGETDYANSIEFKKKLSKNEILKVVVINYNPFLYSSELNKKITSQKAKLPTFLRNLVGNISGNPTTFGVKSFMYDKNIDPSGRFKDKYLDYLVVYRLLKEPKLDCQKIRSALNSIAKIDLLGEYKKLKNLPDNIQIDDVVNLEILVKNAKDLYENDDKCSKVIDSYKLKGEATQVEVVLTPKDGVSGFETPIQVIKGKKGLKIKSKWFVSFSSGVILSRNVQPDYYIQEVAAGQFQIFEERKGNFMAGISTLARVRFQEKDDFSFIVGGGLTTEAVPHLLAGVSHKLFSSFYLDVGYGWAYRNELSDGLSLTQTYTTPPAAIKTKKIFAGDFWFGLSFKL